MSLPAYSCFLCIAVCSLQTHYTSAYGDLVGVRVDTVRAISRIDQFGLTIVKPNVTMTVRLFGTRLHEVAKVYVTTSRRQCSDDHYVHSTELFEEQSPHTVTFPFRFPWPRRQYYFCFEWKEESASGGSVEHQGVARYQHIETRAVKRDPDE